MAADLDRLICRTADPPTVTEADTTARALDGSAPPAERSDGVMWRLVAGVSLISTALGAHEIVPASVTPFIHESMGTGATAPGVLVGVMFGITCS